jgi:hypothetical protein
MLRAPNVCENFYYFNKNPLLTKQLSNPNIANLLPINKHSTIQSKHLRDAATKLPCRIP